MAVASQILNELIIPEIKTGFQDFVCNKKLFLNLDNKDIHLKGPLVAKWDHWRFKGDFTVDENAIIGAERYSGEDMNAFRVDGALDIGKKYKGKLPVASINSFLITSELLIAGDMEGHADCHVGTADVKGRVESSRFVAEGDVKVGDQMFVEGDLKSKQGSIIAESDILAKTISARHKLKAKTGDIRAVHMLDAEEIIALKGEIKASELACHKPINGRKLDPKLNIRKIQAGTPHNPKKIRISDDTTRELLIKGIDEGTIELIAGEIIN